MQETPKKYRSGTPVPEEGFYVFAGYVDGTKSPPPNGDERAKTLPKGQKFPQIGGKDVYWELKPR